VYKSLAEMLISFAPVLVIGREVPME